jgi:hypothetical protein
MPATLHDKIDKLQDTQNEALLLIKEVTVKQEIDESAIAELFDLTAINKERYVGNGEIGVDERLRNLQNTVDKLLKVMSEESAAKKKFALDWRLGAIMVAISAIPDIIKEILTK